MIFRRSSSILVVATFIVIAQITIGQWRKNIGAKIQRTPSGTPTSIRYGRANTFTPQTRYLPSEGRYISSARGLLPSQSRALRMAEGPLPSSGRYSHLFPSGSAVKTIRPYSFTTINRTPTQKRQYGGAYQRSYGKTIKPYNKPLTKPTQTYGKAPKISVKKRKPASGSIRYGLSYRESLTAKYKEPSLRKPTEAPKRIKESSYITGSIRYGMAKRSELAKPVNPKTQIKSKRKEADKTKKHRQSAKRASQKTKSARKK